MFNVEIKFLSKCLHFICYGRNAAMSHALKKKCENYKEHGLEYHPFKNLNFTALFVYIQINTKC